MQCWFQEKKSKKIEKMAPPPMEHDSDSDSSEEEDEVSTEILMQT